jgi:replicative DNA helicase
MSNELNYLKQKEKKLRFKISKAENNIEKVELEIDYFEVLKEIAKMENDTDKAIEYKKKKLQKELEYISLVEMQKEVKTITLKEFLQKEMKDFEYVKSYIKAIDNNLGGIPVGVMIQFAARSYTGKTTTLMRIALNIAKTEKVAHFNFEMSEMILHKVYSNMARNHVEPKQLENLILPEDASSHLDDLIKDIKLLNFRDKVRFFIIDSRMKITTNDKTAKETATNISKKLSELVRELGITIILINQLSEEAIKENRIVLKESGDQFYDADIVLGLGFKYLTDSKNKILKDEMGQPKVDENVRRLICEKNRLGKPFKDEIHINEIFPQPVREITPTQIDIPII